jgi:cobyric acid synthase CobQ/L-threonine-O-3-phosphate decarboxylase
MTSGHGGNLTKLAEQAGCRPEEILDFSANVNPLGPPDGLRQVVSRSLGGVVHYPDPNCKVLCRGIAEALSISPERVACGNGSTELLFVLPKVLGVKRAVIPVPSYIDYETAARKAGLTVETVSPSPETGFSPDLGRLEEKLSGQEMVIVGQPGNPSGGLCDPAFLLSLAAAHPDTFFVVDEAFADFAEEYESLVRHDLPNLIVLRSMTKFYAIPGLRLGYAVASPDLVRNIREALPPWSVGSLAQAAGIAVLEDRDYAEKTRKSVSRLREYLVQGLSDLAGLTVFPSVANYLLLRLDRKDITAKDLFDRLLSHQIAIRVCDNFPGLDDTYFRVAVRTEEENRRLLSALSEVLDAPKEAKTRFLSKPKVPAVMFQGTSSNAGKSVLTAAFGRILLQDGYRVAPFKAQNMSLNSYVTREGGEMGRAQVVQAQACRLDPDVRMNPVLLKPNTDTGSQVILMGKPVGNKDVNGYIDYKARAFETVKAAYDSLSADMDAVVIEGAGSPGEVNLKKHDIVNMAMAEFARAPVLLVGDIDRGGVFAAFIGTMEVLSQREREMVAGFVVNRFRGDPALLGDAFEYVRRHTGIPTLGLVPFIRDLGLPEEDSVSFKEKRETAGGPGKDQVEIAVVDLPHISNFTDVDPLAMEPDVFLRVVRTPGELGRPDAVILPGSKNVPGDLAFLRETGLADAICDLGRKGAHIVGICAGMQMLGEAVDDPYGIESNMGSDQPSWPALALLPIRTVLREEKTLTATTARHVASNRMLRGYEIHHGESDGENLRPAVVREDGKILGFESMDGRVLGTYLHGLFDSDPFRRWFIDRLRTARRLSPLETVQAVFDIEPALDRLADMVRENLDVKTIYKRMGLR